MLTRVLDCQSASPTPRHSTTQLRYTLLSTEPRFTTTWLKPGREIVLSTGLEPKNVKNGGSPKNKELRQTFNAFIPVDLETTFIEWSRACAGGGGGGGQCSILTRRWSRVCYNVRDAGILSQLVVSRLRAWWSAPSRETQSCDKILASVTLYQ